MKHLFFMIIACMSFHSFARTMVSNTGIIWNVSLNETSVDSDVYNNSNIPQICSMEMKVSLLDNMGLVKGFKTISFNNYIILNGRSERFSVEAENMNLGKMNLGEISLITLTPNCLAFNYSTEQISLAMTGALKNSDYVSAQLFQSLAKDTRKIKFLNVSSSFFNIDSNEFDLNHLEVEKTTFLIKSNEQEKACRERPSIKCGPVYFEEASKSCGVLEYNSRRSSSCGCETRKGGPCIGSCGCKTYKTCARPKFGVKRYKTCRDTSHGIENVKSCFLKVNSSGEFEKCSL